MVSRRIRPKRLLLGSIGLGVLWGGGGQTPPILSRVIAIRVRVFSCMALSAEVAVCDVYRAVPVHRSRPLGTRPSSKRRSYT